MVGNGRLSTHTFLSQLLENYRNVKKAQFGPNPGLEHSLFLAACLVISPTSDLMILSSKNPYGGLIGYGDSRKCHAALSRYKVLRLHAALHDAYGFMKEEFDEGPGYCYAFPLCPSHFWTGHLTGIAYCIFVKICFPSFYNSLLI